MLKHILSEAYPRCGHLAALRCMARVVAPVLMIVPTLHQRPAPLQVSQSAGETGLFSIYRDLGRFPAQYAPEAIK